MNWLGKVFVILILVMSLVFMAFSMAVYTAHRNWFDEAQALSKKVDEVSNENGQLKDQKNRLESRLQADVEAMQSQVAKLENERNNLATESVDLQKEIEELRQQQRQRIALVTAAEQNNRGLSDEAARLRSDLQKEQVQADANRRKAVAAQDELQQKLAELVRLEETKQQLVAEAARLKSIVVENNLNPKDQAIPEVFGEIEIVSNKNGETIVVVSIGADDGLKRGQTLEIYRRGRYLGRAEIKTTEPDQAIGRVIIQTGGPIQVGDRVATKLRV